MSAASVRLSELVDGFAELAAGADRPVWGVEADSRRVRPGELFLAARGRSRHGLAFLQQALDQGASAVAWEPGDVEPPRVCVPAVAVPRLSERLGEIAARFYGRPSRVLSVTGVTGTDGKTSVAHIAAQTLNEAGMPCAYLGTLGFGVPGELRPPTHTTPDPVALQRWLAHFAAAGVRATAMEVSSHALDQSRVAGVQVRIAVLTNLTRDHLDYHGTLEAYAAAKRRLFSLPGLEWAVLNADDSHGRRWLAELHGQARTLAYGFGGRDGLAGAGERYLCARSLACRPDGLRLELASSWGEGTVDSPLLGRFNAYNLMAAGAVLLLNGVAWRATLAALERARTVPGRMEAFRAARRPLVVVDYAHTPGALEQALSALRAHCRGRLWCVFGCGGGRDRGKRALMGAAAARHADELIVTDDNPRDEDPAAIVRDILSGLPAGRSAPVEHDRGRAIERALSAAASNDAILVAGKGHETVQVVGGERRAFSDRHFVAGRLGLEVAA